MAESFDNYVNLDWLNVDNSQVSNDPALSLVNPPQELDIANISSSDLFQYFLDGELSAIDAIEYDNSTETMADPLMVITPNELLQSATSSLQNFTPLTSSSFQSLSIGDSSTPSEPHFEMPGVKQEPGPIDTAELLRGLDARIAAMTATSKAAQAQSDKIATDAQMGGLTAVKEENGNDEKSDGEEQPIDPKKLSSKERRQLRNKISARNFRVRRKEYISTLESQVALHQTEARDLRAKLLTSEIENEKLRAENTILHAHAASTTAELERLRQALASLQVSPRSPPSDNTSIKSPNLTIASALTSRSPTLTKPNLKKDVSINGTRAGFVENQRILVSS